MRVKLIKPAVELMKKKAFTLVEMLMVLAIIGLLLGMLLPVLSKVKEQSRRTKARHMVGQLTTAWQAYLRDHRMFPSGGPNEVNPSPDNAVEIQDTGLTALRVLAGSNYTAGIRVEYMEFTTNEWSVTRGLVDPWGSYYRIALDNGKGGDTMAYDGKVKVPQNTDFIMKDVVVWSKGPDKQDDQAASGDDVKSWE